MKHLGDITKIHNAPFVDCITFGSPCQDLSIAGKRAGLAGERSGLFMEAVRVIKEMRDKSGGLYPTFAVWENVPGAFSSNGGEDFRAVLEELASTAKGRRVAVPEPPKGKWRKAGYMEGNRWSIAWRTFDAQFWGVPQRRKRIALVVDFGGQRAGEILFERTGVPGHPDQSIPPWKGIARNPADGAAGHDRVAESTGFTNRGRYSGVVSETLRAESHGAIPMVCAAFTAKTAGQGTAGDAANRTGADDCEGECVEVLPFDTTQVTSPQNGCNPKWGDPRHPLAAQGHPPTVICKCYDKKVYSIENHPADSRVDIDDSGKVKILTSRMGTGGGNVPMVMEPVRASDQTEVFVQYIVLRLTPTECERLQGFPDGWTDIGDWTDSKGKRHKPSDSPRYKALGNSIALPQWWWLTCKMAQYLPEHATLGSLFDGIGGFPLVWETRHGKGTALWASEIEEFPIAVTKRRFEE